MIQKIKRHSEFNELYILIDKNGVELKQRELKLTVSKSVSQTRAWKFGDRWSRIVESGTLATPIGVDLCFERKYGGVDGRHARDKRRRRKTTETRTRGECREEKITLAQSDRVAVAGKVLHILYLKGARRPQPPLLSLSLYRLNTRACAWVLRTRSSRSLTLARYLPLLSFSHSLILSFSHSLILSRPLVSWPVAFKFTNDARRRGARFSRCARALFSAPREKRRTYLRSLSLEERETIKKRERKGREGRSVRSRNIRDGARSRLFPAALRCDSKRSISLRRVASRRVAVTSGSKRFGGAKRVAEQRRSS